MIETQGLARYFGNIKAVDGVTFQVAKGEVLGFLGPNGAGKSTTMKMLTCFLSPSAGTAKVAGYDILEQSREVRAQIGYLPENAPLYGEMEVRDFLEFIAEVRGVEKARHKSAIDRVVQMTSLQGVVSQRIETLSKGFKRRVGLAQALIHDPQILILDEPTDGLDPNQKHEVRELINSMAKDKCIVLSTHILEEVDECCTRVVIIAKGRIVADSTPFELRKRSQVHGAVTVSFKKAPGGDIRTALEKVEGVRRVETHTTTEGIASYTLFPAQGREIVYSIMNEAQRNSWSLENLRLESGHLDEVFREITR